MSVVLDASAIIAMLKGERGAAKVAAEIGGARVSSVN
jgi:PIN domain nuclease of toxin-antitoxin system